LIGDKEPRHIVQPLQQFPKEALGGALVPALLDQDIQHLAILIDCTPQIVALAINRDKHFVEIPRVTQPPLAVTQLLGEGRPEFQTPLTDRLVADGDPTLGQQFFHVPKAEAKTVIKPDGIGNDLRWKAVATIWGR
jgi:hypothetical protein